MWCDLIRLYSTFWVVELSWGESILIMTDRSMQFATERSTVELIVHDSTLTGSLTDFFRLRPSSNIISHHNHIVHIAWYYVILYHIISYHIVQYYNISYHNIWNHIISYHIIWLALTLLHFSINFIALDGTSQPSLNAFVAMMQGASNDTGINYLDLEVRAFP